MTNAELEKLLAEASPGPWRRGQQGNLRIYAADGMDAESGAIAELVPHKAGQKSANLELMAASRELAIEVLRLRKGMQLCLEELMQVYHSEFDGVWTQADFDEIEAKHLAVLEQLS